MTSGKAVLSGERTRRFLTSSVTGPDDGVASPRLFVGVPLLHWLNLNSVARPGARGVGLLERLAMRYFCYLIGLGALVLLAACASKSSALLHAPPNDEPPFQLTFPGSDPVLSEFSESTRYLRVIVEPALSTSSVLTLQWTPEGPATIRCQFVDGSEYYKATKQYVDTKGSIHSWLSRPVALHDLQRTCSNQSILNALEAIWRQLNELTFYKEPGYDGVTYTIEAYGNSGVLRRMQLWSPECPETGEYLVGLLNLLARYPLSYQISPNEVNQPNHLSHAVASRNGQQPASAMMAKIADASASVIASEEAIRSYKYQFCSPPHRLPDGTISASPKCCGGQAYLPSTKELPEK